MSEFPNIISNNEIQRPIYMGIQELRELKGNKNISDGDKLSEMDRQFESIMVRMMLKDAFKDIKNYDYFVTDVLADSITARDRLFGINYSSQIKHISNQPTQ